MSSKICLARINDALLDEMTLSPQVTRFASLGKHKLAKHELVFMVKGIKKEYTHPLAYYFTSDMNKTELKHCYMRGNKELYNNLFFIYCCM